MITYRQGEAVQHEAVASVGVPASLVVAPFFHWSGWLA